MPDAELLQGDATAGRLYAIARGAADGSGNVTLTFDPVKAGHTWTGSVTVVPGPGGSVAGANWQLARTGQPLIAWSDNQVAVDIQGREDDQITITGGGLAAGTLVVAIWAGRNDLTSGAPIASPYVSGAPSQTLLSQAINASASVIASALQSAGVPPIDNPAAIFNGIVFNQSIASGGTFTSARLNVAKYQSIVGTIFAQEQTGGGLGTSPYFRIVFSWSLVSDNYDPLRVPIWVPAVGPFSFVANYRNDYSSPCFGDTLTMTFFNYDSKPINVTYGLFGSYRARALSSLRGRYPDDLSNEATGLGGDQVLLAQSVSLGPGASQETLMNLADGPVSVYFESGSAQANPSRFDIFPQPQSVLQGGPSNGPEYQFAAYAGTPANDSDLALPRRACTVKMTNNDVAAHTHKVLIVAKTQPE